MRDQSSEFRVLKDIGPMGAVTIRFEMRQRMTHRFEIWIIDATSYT
jgi:hypothetical protein